MQLRFIAHKKIYYVLSAVLLSLSIMSLFVFGLNPGIDFTGGSILEVEFQDQRPANQQIRESLDGFGLGDIYVQPSSEKGMIIKMKDVPEETHQSIVQKLSGISQLEEKRFESLGPVIGRELKEKTVTLIAFALFAMVIYIALAFRRVSRPVSSWQYALVSLMVLSHDVVLPLGIFSVLGRLYGVQMTIPVVVALLTVVGYAINNVVVVFDRVRENLVKRVGVTFEETIDKSINQTLTRCLNTSLTTTLVLLALLFFGGDTLRYFSLALITGIAAGTYSSIFLAAPLLTIFKK